MLKLKGAAPLLVLVAGMGLTLGLAASGDRADTHGPETLIASHTLKAAEPDHTPTPTDSGADPEGPITVRR